MKINTASTGLACSAALAATLSAAPALGQLDTEPTNDSRAGADALLVGTQTGAAVTVASLSDGGTDADFFSATAGAGQVLFGIVTPLAGLPDDFDGPDTIAVTFTSAGTPLTYSDDLEAETNVPAGDSLGSGFRLLAPAADTYAIGVGGFRDENFDGLDDQGDPGNGVPPATAPQGEVGRYALTVGRIDPATLGGDFADTEASVGGGLLGNNTIAGADPILAPRGTAAVAVAELDLGSSGIGDDVDFFSIFLTAGDVLSAMTAPLDTLDDGDFDTPDTRLGLFDPDGNLLFSNDDSGDFGEAANEADLLRLASDNPFDAFFGSAILAVAPVDGLYYVAVTGESDRDFDGLTDFDGTPHENVGRYGLLVSTVRGSAVPEPSSLALLGAGGLVLSRRRRPRRTA